MRAFFVLALLAAAPLAAQQSAELPGQPDPSRVVAGTYIMDSDHTQVGFTVNHFGFTPYTGQAGGATGTLALDPRNLAATKLDVTIPASGIVTTVPKLDVHLATPDFFDSKTYPTIRFVSTKVEATGDRARITGNLTLHGVTRPVVLDAAFVGAGINPMQKKLNIGFTATAAIKRSDFGMSTYIPIVSDEVKLDITGAFAAQ